MDWCKGAIRRSAAALAAALLTFALCLVAAGGAGAVVVKLADGQMLGVAPRAGVAPTSIPGARRPAARPSLADNGNVVYQGGPVVHSSAPYLIFWDPSSTIPASTKTLLTKYFIDVSHDGGRATNVYGMLRQYNDQTGIADYQQTFTSGHAIVDSRAFPTRDTTNCVDSAPSDEVTCVTDGQLQSELTRLIAAQGLPVDGLASASAFVSGAPIYFIVTPPNVNVCSQGPNGGKSAQCADNVFCAYHSSYTDGANTVLYASIPLINAFVTDPANGLNPKFCQADNNTAIQQPNADSGDVALKYLSHEDAETITDPLGTAWFDGISGNEVGDNCNFWNGQPPPDAPAGNEPSAFEPTLGGSASPVSPATTGTLFDQLINGHHYYTQSEWSNGDVDCQMQPSASTLVPSFTGPSGVVAVGSPIGFDPGPSSTSGGYSSVAWTFGDGGTSFVSTATTSNPVPASLSHVYAAPGVYTATLTLVDTHGNLARTSHTVSVGRPPSATFTASTVHSPVGGSVSFNGTGSSASSPGTSISSYDWSFGDGGRATGATTSHAYSSAGGHTVTLTVTDDLGLTASATQTVDVTAPGQPAVSRGSLSGLGKGKAKLSFELLAGLDAPNLHKVAVALPSGLSFVKKGVTGGVSAKGASAQKLSFAATLSHGKLTLTLHRAVGAVKLSITARALKESRTLRHKVRSAKIKSLAIAVTAIDTAGTATALTLAAKV